MWRRLLAVAIALGLSCSKPSAGTNGSSSAGVVRHATDLEGRPVDPFARSTTTTVLVFVSTECPVSNRYAPEIQKLHDQYAPRGVTFLLVYPSRSDSVDAIKKHLHDYAYTLDAVRDPEHAIVERAGVDTTPEVAVVTAGGEVVYRGRIDDRQVDFGKARPEPTRRDLALALDAVLAGRPVEVKATPAVGCPIGAED